MSEQPKWTPFSERILQALRTHWLSAIHCNHNMETDESSCACGLFMCPPQQSVGDAVQRWIEHVAEMASQAEFRELRASGLERTDEPDVFEVLKECGRYFANRPGNWEYQMSELIDAALAKATGEA